MSIAVKICGLRREKDIEAVNKYLPDYAGFVFATSKRKVTKEEARLLIEKLDKKIKAVGVFVNSSVDEVNEIASYAGLDIVQLHGDETPDMCRAIDKPVWRALSVKDNTIINELNKYKDCCNAFVLDNGRGGTGEKFDWDIIKNISEQFTIFLAGGLYPENVENAVKEIKPFGVDTSSGVETDGWKDEYKIAKFIVNARK